MSALNQSTGDIATIDPSKGGIDPLHVVSHEPFESTCVNQHFLKEVHHRVKNNLQVVCSLLRLQGRGVSDTGAKDAFKRSEERIQSMALVYDKLYRGDDFDTVPLDQYLREMTGQLVSSICVRGERPELDYRLQPVLVNSRLATSVGLLLNEIISSYLRVYAKDSRGPLSLVLVRRDQHVILELHGNEPVSTPRAALGVVDQQILDALVRQVEGVIEYTVDGNDTTRISFPVRSNGGH